MSQEKSNLNKPMEDKYLQISISGISHKSEIILKANSLLESQSILMICQPEFIKQFVYINLSKKLRHCYSSGAFQKLFLGQKLLIIPCRMSGSSSTMLALKALSEGFLSNNHALFQLRHQRKL